MQLNTLISNPYNLIEPKNYFSLNSFFLFRSKIKFFKLFNMSNLDGLPPQDIPNIQIATLTALSRGKEFFALAA